MAATTSPIKLDFTTVDVFTTTRYKGNPLAVVSVPYQTRPLITQEIKQRIAREFNLSETVFLHGTEDESATTRDIDIFTTEEELPFAGHPTVGTAYLVLNKIAPRVNTLQTKAGPIAIQPLGDGDVKATIPHAVHIHAHTLTEILSNGEASTQSLIQSALSSDAVIREAELGARPVSIVRGMTFLLVQLPTLDHLSRVSTTQRLDFGSVPGLMDKGEWEAGFVARYYYVVSEDSPAVDSETETQKWKIQTRMVELGFEDPATGSAACTLGSYLALTNGGQKHHFDITQGVEMGRKSDIQVDVTTTVDGEEENVKEVFLGGTAVEVMSGSIVV